MLKKQSILVLFLLGTSLMISFQNCGQSDQSNLFGSNCDGDKCSEDPNLLDLELDPQLLSSGTYKISTNPSGGFKNLRLTGRCESAGFNRSLIKAKIYSCSGGNCGTLKHISSAPCSSSARFEIASTVSNLSPGVHRLNLEIVGINEFGQEVYGHGSKKPPINAQAAATINPPVLASFSGANFWAQDNFYYFPTSTEKVVLDGYITGFCDYNSMNTQISVKLSVKGSSLFQPLATTTCQPIVTGSMQDSSPNRNGRTGFFQLDSFTIFMTYVGGSFVNCESGDNNCVNNILNKMTNRLVSLAVSQYDQSFKYDVYSVRKLILHYKSERSGKGWLAEVLAETLKRVKRSFNFSNSSVSGELNGAQSGTNDFSQAFRILTSAEEFYDPLITSGDTRYGFGTRTFITKWLLGATEDVSTSEYNNTNIFFLGNDYTIPYKSIAVGNANNFLLCSGNIGLADPITGFVGAETAEAGIDRIALCLSFRYLNGLWNMGYTEALKIVQEGVTFANSNTNCFYKSGGPISNQNCAVIADLLNATITAKARSFPNASISNASTTQLKYFGNGLTQYYINKIMYNLAYRNTGMGGENEIFAAIFNSVYPEITDINLRRSLYPTELNYIGSTTSFGGMRSRPFASGSTDFTYTGQ